MSCKASKMLCGKPCCPLLIRYHSLLKTMPLTNLQMEGSSPPGIFVGRFGYPRVNIGPLVPPFRGDTSLLDLPEAWLDFSIDDIVGFRSQLVRGLHRVDVTAARKGKRFVDLLQELAVAALPSDVEVEFSRRPRGNLVLDDDAQPYGPSAPLLRMDTCGVKSHHRLERAWLDGDLKAEEAILWLYREGVEVSKISRALSAGTLGMENNRRFVPTRWSITAVDDTIGRHLVKKVKRFPLINEFRVYESWKLDNRFVILLFPQNWSYELVEAWYPGSTWNLNGRSIVMFGDWEGYRNRSSYAEVGGCYYAARLAIAEALCREGRHAGALVLREAHPGYVLPVGVWNVRENVRRAMSQPYREFSELKDALLYLSQRLEIPLRQWMERSWILRSLLLQRRLSDFPGVGG